MASVASSLHLSSILSRSLTACELQPQINGDCIYEVQMLRHNGVNMLVAGLYEG